MRDAKSQPTCTVATRVHVEARNRPAHTLEVACRIPRTIYDLVNAGQAVNRNDIEERDLILCNWSARAHLST